jgi:hypothetical protein
LGAKISKIGTQKYVAIPEHSRTFTIFRVKSMLDRIYENGGRFSSKNHVAEGDYVHRIGKPPSAVVRAIRLPLSPKASMVQM